MGALEFNYPKHGLVGKMEFAKEGGIFSRNNLPLDCITGSILKHGMEVCKI